jgi:hypothetical protein
LPYREWGKAVLKKHVETIVCYASTNVRGRKLWGRAMLGACNEYHLAAIRVQL